MQQPTEGFTVLLMEEIHGQKFLAAQPLQLVLVELQTLPSTEPGPGYS